MADICRAAVDPDGQNWLLICVLPRGHDGPHFDRIDHLAWRVVTSHAMPRVTQALLTPSADLPACRDEDPATPAVLAAAYPDPPEYAHPEDDDG